MVVKASGLHKALPAVASFLNLSAPPPSLQSGAESPPADDGGGGAGPACPPSYPDMKPVRSDPGAADSCPTRNRVAVLLQVRVSKFPLRLIQTSRLGVLTKPVIIRLGARRTCWEASKPTSTLFLRSRSFRQCRFQPAQAPPTVSARPVRRPWTSCWRLSPFATGARAGQPVRPFRRWRRRTGSLLGNLGG